MREARLGQIHRVLLSNHNYAPYERLSYYVQRPVRRHSLIQLLKFLFLKRVDTVDINN